MRSVVDEAVVADPAEWVLAGHAAASSLERGFGSVLTAALREFACVLEPV